MSDEKRIAVCPGTYDPITLGHIDVITRTARIFDEVVVAVVNLPVRKGSTLFPVEERLAFIEDAVGVLGNVRAVPFDTLVVDFAREIGASTIVKGLRAISDFEYESEMAQLNRQQARQEYYAYSTAQFLVYGPQRVQQALDLLRQEFEFLFTPYYIHRGSRYVAPYLEALTHKGN